jgi:hypothetical protein
MYVPLRRFSSIEELAPVFAHGGKIIFVDLIINPGLLIVKGKDPWEIVLRSMRRSLDDQKETLLHEFVHLFHNSGRGYCVDLNETRIFNETEAERQTKRLLKHNPRIVDEIARELILHPNCSIIFPPDDPYDNPFRSYYRDLVAQLAKNGT